MVPGQASASLARNANSLLQPTPTEMEVGAQKSEFQVALQLMLITLKSLRSTALRDRAV